MTPQLTEAWSIAYLQILIVLLIFALSVPSIISQVTLPDRYRCIVNRYMKRYYLTVFTCIVIVILIFCLCFIWFLHPCTISISKGEQLAGSIIISISLVFFIIFWSIYVNRLSKERIVYYLEKKINKKYQEYGPKLTTEMTDIITLGERSEAGHEKEIVLRTLERLTESIQDSVHYSGHDLEFILRDLDKIIISKDKPGNETDYKISVDILEKILDRLVNKNMFGNGEERLVYKTLKEIGKKAVEMKFSKVVLRTLGIASKSPGTLFEIGLSAFQAGDYFSSLAALSKLETLILETETSENDSNVKDYYFGLLAHFWTKNKSSRKRAEDSLESFKDEFFPIDEVLAQPIKKHYNDARYDTADKLMTMRDEIGA